MIYRKLDGNGDYSFGNGLGSFYVDNPEAVAQAVATRLQLQLGEWFLDTSDGTAWSTKVLGKNTAGSRDAIIKARVTGTVGVVDYTGYNSQTTPQRQFSVAMTLDTVYGQAYLSGLLSPPVLP